jgi:regulator of protease activity HflC (stomatin/prohibitin superfamily)
VGFTGILVALVFGAWVLMNVFRIVPQYERLVIFRLGKLYSTKGGFGPGLVIVLPVIDSVRRVSIQTVAMDIPSQDVITKDNVSLNVNAVVYYRVVDPERAIVEVQDYLYATGMLAQTTLRSVMGQSELDEILSNRDTLNQKLQELLDQQTEGWGVKVSNVEIKSVDLPKEMQRAMSRQAEAERERRAKVIAAEGELQASRTLAEAAGQLAKEPITIQLRYLQTLTEIGNQNATTIVFPVPMDLFKSVTGAVTGAGTSNKS